MDDMELFRPRLRIFIDESGTPDKFVKGKHQEHDKYFTLAAVIISEIEYKKYKKGIYSISAKYKKYIQGEEIKSNYIRCSNPDYVRGKPKYTPVYTFYQDQENGKQIYEEFCEEIKVLITATDFQIVSVTTNKEVAGKKYPHLNLHDVMLNDLWERIAIHIMLLEESSKIRIMFDPTKGNADIILRDSYAYFKQHGSWYFTDERMEELNKFNLDKSVYPCDSEECIGLQLADLCAYPIKKQAEHQNNKFFKDIIRGKLRAKVQDTATRKGINMGMKITLN
jgi:hypothetical protein